MDSKERSYYARYVSRSAWNAKLTETVEKANREAYHDVGAELDGEGGVAGKGSPETKENKRGRNRTHMREWSRRLITCLRRAGTALSP
jgi:hypothetical protein